MMITCLTDIVDGQRQPSTSTWKRSTLCLGDITKTHFAVRICQFFEDRQLSRSFQVTENVKVQSKSLVHQGKVKIKFKKGAQNTVVNILCRSAELKMFVRAVELIVNHEKKIQSMFTSHLFCRDGCLILHWGKLVEFQPYSTSILKMNRLSLETIDSTVFSLVSLQTVDFTDNDLKELPETVGSLPLLRHLYLVNNNLGQGNNWRWVASPIIRKNLEILDLRGNGMMYVPEEICNMRNLEVLDLSRNELSELPAQIGKLSKLRWLDASCNKLTCLPGSMQRLSLSELHLKGNNFVMNTKKPTFTASDFILPSLREIVAKYIVQSRFPHWEYILPNEVTMYLEDVSYCICGRITFSKSPVCHVFRSVWQRILHSEITIDVPFAVQFCSYSCSRAIFCKSGTF